jgi:hypothetical protein
MLTAHPDDELLFGYDFLTTHKKCLVCCVSNGKDQKRKLDFIKIVESLGHKPLLLDNNDKWHSEDISLKVLNQISHLLKTYKWKKIITHNLAGEYLHSGHMSISYNIHIICEKHKKLSKLYTFGKSSYKRAPTQYSNLMKIYDDQMNTLNELHSLGYKSYKNHFKYGSPKYKLSLHPSQIPICKPMGKQTNHKVNKYFDTVLVMNLARDTKKFNDTSLLLKKEGIKAYSFPAILGKQLTLENTSRDDLTSHFVAESLKKSPGGLGQLVSFIKILRLIIRSPSLNRVLLLEDDIKFLPDFKNRFTQAINEVPDNWDLCYLGMSQLFRDHGMSWDYPIKGLTSQSKYNDRLSEMIIRPKGGTGLYAVGVTKEGAKKILKHLLPISDKTNYKSYKQMLIKKLKNDYENDYPTIASMDIYISKIFQKLNVYYMMDNKNRDLITFKSHDESQSSINIVGRQNL